VDKPSETALLTALMRAVHTRRDPAPLLDDPWGDRLVPDSARALFRARAFARLAPQAQAEVLARGGAAGMDEVLDASLRASVAYPGVIGRSRYTEDFLRAAVATGVGQYAMIGAGFDSFSVRRPPFAAALEVFEIDHPATQGLKRQRLAECGIWLPGTVHFVEADLGREEVAPVLARAGFRSSERAFFSWLGVTMYLTREANLATLRAIASCGASGSELVFTYYDDRLNRQGGSGFAEMAARVAALGEPFKSGFDPDQLHSDLQSVGLELLEDLDDVAVIARYDARGVNGLKPSAFSHVVRACIA
jgi:methyltransferase (TIGR00027 family)